MSPTPEQATEWCVLLNCWTWPTDLPGKPNPPGGLTRTEARLAIRGAYAAVEQFADPELVDAIWRDEDRRTALVEAHIEGQVL